MPMPTPLEVIPLSLWQITAAEWVVTVFRKPCHDDKGAVRRVPMAPGDAGRNGWKQNRELQRHRRGDWWPRLARLVDQPASGLNGRVAVSHAGPERSATSAAWLGTLRRESAQIAACVRLLARILRSKALM